MKQLYNRYTVFCILYNAFYEQLYILVARNCSQVRKIPKFIFATIQSRSKVYRKCHLNLRGASREARD